MAAGVNEEHGGLDILVNNAGVCVDAPAMDTTKEIWRAQMAVNSTPSFIAVTSSAVRWWRVDGVRSSTCPPSPD